MELRKFIATTIREYLNEHYSFNYTETQKLNSKKLFLELFDYYLRRVSSKTYPMIWHNTTIDRYENIKKFGLTGKLNYFSDNDNDMIAYGQYDETGEEINGIAVGVNYKEVSNRLYPDPEWVYDIIVKTGNPSNFKKHKINDDIILCVLVEEMLGLDSNKNLSLSDVPKQKIKDIINGSTFMWLYVKGRIDSNLLTIKIHPDLEN
jgi:hypothetical protein